jgi:hypothetical protein
MLYYSLWNACNWDSREFFGKDLMATVVRVYLYDVGVSSDIEVERAILLKKSFERLNAVDIKIRIEKCFFSNKLSDQILSMLILSDAPGFLGGLLMLQRLDTFNWKERRKKAFGRSGF